MPHDLAAAGQAAQVPNIRDVEVRRYRGLVVAGLRQRALLDPLHLAQRGQALHRCQREHGAHEAAVFGRGGLLHRAARRFHGIRHWRGVLRREGLDHHARPRPGRLRRRQIGEEGLDLVGRQILLSRVHRRLSLQRLEGGGREFGQDRVVREETADGRAQPGQGLTRRRGDRHVELDDERRGAARGGGLAAAGLVRHVAPLRAREAAVREQRLALARNGRVGRETRRREAAAQRRQHLFLQQRSRCGRGRRGRRYRRARESGKVGHGRRRHGRDALGQTR